MSGRREDKANARPDMRPFAVIGVVIVLLVAIVFVLYRGTSFMITSIFDNTNNASEFACSSDRMYATHGGEWSELDVKAMAVGEGDERYFGGWAALLEKVAATGANTVVAQDVMSPGFYDALKQWNESGRNGALYLVQRVRLGENAYVDMEDIVDGDAAGKLLDQGKLAVDVVHGSRILQGYFTDVSPYVVGFCIGDDWDPDLLAYTQQRREGEIFEYIGIYYTCTSPFLPFEARLAQTMDALFSYEIGKFNHRTPLGVWNWSKTDEIVHSPAAMRDSTSIATLWQSYIEPTGECQVGTFACYNLFDESEPMVVADANYGAAVESGEASSVYEAYVADTVGTATGPVIVSTRASSARGTTGSAEGDGKRFGAADESGQGKRYLELIEGAFASGASGFSVPLVDDVHATSWNTEDVSESNGLWRNVQCPDQYCGVFAVGDSPAVVLDGDDAEWSGVEPVASAGSDTLKVRYDSEYVYLCVETEGFDRATDSLAIPFDVTPLSGAGSYEGLLPFDRDVDFVVDLSGDVPELQVQRYYNHYWAVQTLTHTEMNQPDRHAQDFGTFYQCVQRQDYLSDGVTVQEIESEYYPTGGLVEGRDYAVGESCVELRVPWALLNFYDPSSGTVLGDYYEMDSVENRLLHIDEMYVGLNLNGGDERVRLAPVALPGWTDVNWTAHEKASLDQVARAFEKSVAR